jgi:hypothetical protein
MSTIRLTTISNPPAQADAVIKTILAQAYSEMIDYFAIRGGLNMNLQSVTFTPE